MLLAEISETGWIILGGIASSTIISVVTIIVTKRGIQQRVDANASITKAAADVIIGKADRAALHAKKASEVGMETLKGVRQAAHNAEVAAESVKELKEDSKLGRSPGHIEGDSAPKHGG